MGFDWQVLGNGIWCFFANGATPAWVQAIGSILALWIVIRVSKTSIDHAASAKRKTIFAIAEAAHTRACSIRKAIDVMGWPSGDNTQIYNVYNKAVITSVVKALQGIPMHELGSSKAVPRHAQPNGSTGISWHSD